MRLEAGREGNGELKAVCGLGLRRLTARKNVGSVVLPEATNVVVVVAATEKLIHRGFRSESVRRRLLGANRERE